MHQAEKRPRATTDGHRRCEQTWSIRSEIRGRTFTHKHATRDKGCHEAPSTLALLDARHDTLRDMVSRPQWCMRLSNTSPGEADKARLHTLMETQWAMYLPVTTRHGQPIGRRYFATGQAEYELPRQVDP